MKTRFRNLLKETITFAAGLVLWILLLPLILLIFLPLGILRFTVHYFAKRFQPDLIPSTKTVDALAIFNPSSSFFAINAAQVWKIKGKLDVSEFREQFYKLFLSDEDLREKYRNFYCYFVQWCGYCFKKPVETIVLEDQIREYKLKDGETLDGFIGKWQAVNDYGSKPNWEILIIHNMNQKNHEKSDGNEEDSWDSVLLFKIDHGLCDGYSFVHLVEKLSGVKSPYIVSKEEISIWTKAKYIITFPAHFFTYLVMISRTEDLLQPMNNTGSDWMISFTTLDLERIKNVRRKTKTHFNTVVGMFQVGALRRHLLETGKAESIKQLPKYTWLPSPKALPNHPAMIRGGMTNHLTMGFTKVPFQTEDRLERLLAAEKDQNKFVRIGFEKVVDWVLLKLTWTLPAPIQRFLLKFATHSRWSPSHILSPLMCANAPYTLLGHPVQNLYLPLLTKDGFAEIGIYVVPVSHSGQLDVSVNGSSSVFKSQEDLDRFTKIYLADELQLLEQACNSCDSSV